MEAAVRPVEVPALPEKAPVVPPAMPKQEVPKQEEQVPEVPEVPEEPESLQAEEAAEEALPAVAPGRRLMTKKDGFLWAGVVAVLFMAAMWATYGLRELRYSSEVMRFLTCEFMQAGLLVGWAVFVFRRQGKRLWCLAGTMIGGYGVSLVVLGIFMAMLDVLEVGSWKEREIAVLVLQSFLYPFVLVLWLFLGLRWMMGAWHWKLFICGAVTAIVYAPIAWLCFEEGSYGAEPVYVVGALVVGAVFGGTGAWALVSSRKVRV